MAIFRDRFSDPGDRVKEEIRKIQEDINILLYKVQQEEKALSEIKITVFNRKKATEKQEEIRARIAALEKTIAANRERLAQKYQELNSSNVTTDTSDVMPSAMPAAKSFFENNKYLITIVGICLVMLLVSKVSGWFKPHEHTWIEATCVAPKTCETCGKTEGEPLGHVWMEATCTQPKTCSICGSTEGDALGHSWKEATCTEPKTCAVCHETLGNPLGHTVAEYTVTREPTCGKEGLSEGRCSRCMQTITQPVPATGQHEYGEWTVVREPRCRWPGEQQHSCLVCDNKETEMIPALGHDDDNTWVITRHATEKSSGERVTHCSRCGDVCQKETYDML